MNIRLLAALLLLSVPQAQADLLIVAHRGASRDAPENTLPAFKLAWQQGADAIEGDFHLTKDGKIVCLHDYDTKRVSGVKRVIKDTTLDELRALDAGAWFKPEWKGTRLPTFAEVAATVPASGKFYIEVKCGPEIVPVLLRELAATTGGSFFREEDLHRLPAAVQSKTLRVTSRAAVEVWSSPLAFLAILILLGAEWALRKLWQLK